nr:hypothetical protein Iba_chr07eCG11380 [Ipomoea batatas]
MRKHRIQHVECRRDLVRLLRKWLLRLQAPTIEHRQFWPALMLWKVTMLCRSRCNLMTMMKPLLMTMIKYIRRGNRKALKGKHAKPRLLRTRRLQRHSLSS